LFLPSCYSFPVMIKRNWHTHTSRCGHACGSDEQYVEAALAAGLEVLGFSDHVPYAPSSPTVRMNLAQFSDYLSSLQNLKKKYAGRLEIHTGVEAEYFPDQKAHLQKIRSQVEYMILGQHTLSLDGYSCYDIRDREHLNAYCDRLEEGLSLGLYDCLAHPDVCMWSYPCLDESVTATAGRIADLALKYGVPVELNCGSGVHDYGFHHYQDGDRYVYPTVPFFRVFAEKKVPVLIGMDIHNPQDFLTDIYLTRALDIVKGLKLNYCPGLDLSQEAQKRQRR
jgi:histidinol-phosphatase (PHP family)